MSQTKDLWVRPAIDTAWDAGNNPPENITQTSLIMLLCDSLVVLWKDWPKDMNLSVLDESNWKFSLTGTCPHGNCQSKSVFLMVGEKHMEAAKNIRNTTRVVSIMQCQGCLGFILGMILRHGSDWNYETHYPLGMADDTVDENVPKPIAEDFAEAVRCQFANSPKAAVAMCRRSVEASCNDLGAKGKNLKAKINDLADKRKITDSLQAMAHAVRITANERLHGSSKSTTAEVVTPPKVKPDEPESEESTLEIVTSDLDAFGKTEAEKMIDFVKHFFYHVYVVPELLKPYQEAEG